MAAPEFTDLLDEEVATSEAESCNLINKVDDARSLAAYWQGRCEGLEAVIAQMKAGHQDVIAEIDAAHGRAVEALVDAHEATLAYLKGRLDLLEGRVPVAPPRGDRPPVAGGAE